MSTRQSDTSGGLTAFDILKIVGVIIVALVAIRLVGAVIGAVMSVIWTVLIAAVVIGGLWIAWSMRSKGKRAG
ncbi:MAG: hypothetical protein WC558_13645 [Patulibacter sp.]